MELAPQERFNQLLSFLKDPQAHPHPDITLDGLICVREVEFIPLQAKVLRREAIEIMESGMFQSGLLKGNKRTPDLSIEKLERFVLQAAAAIDFAKDGGPPDFYYIGPNGRPVPPIEDTLIEAFLEMMMAFQAFKEFVLNPPPPVIKGKNLINPVMMHRLGRELNSLLDRANKKVNQEIRFDLVNELILIFLRHVPKAPNNLIASHIFSLIDIRRNSSLMGVYLPEQDAIRKKVEPLREKFITTP